MPDPRTPTDRRELLKRVIRRGDQLRWRRRAAVGAIAAVTLSVAMIAGVTALRDPLVRSVGDVIAEPTPTPSGGDPDSTPTPTIEPTSAPAAQGTEPPSTAKPDCRNSTDPACGPFYWDPEPEENQPMTVTVEAEPSQGKVGESFAFKATATDDAARRPWFLYLSFGDGQAISPGTPSCDDQPKRYGPWTPPPRKDKSSTESTWFEHTYEKAGSYTVRFTYSTERCDPEHRVDPYAGQGEGSVTITVTT